MALEQIGLAAAITWELSKSNTGFTNTVHGPESASFTSNALSTATWTEVLAAQYTIASSGTQVVSLRSFTDLAGNSVTGTKAMAIIIIVTGAVADRLNVKKDASNGLQWFFQTPAVGDADAGIDIPGGGFFMFSEGSSSTGTTVDASNAELLLTNNGSADLTVKVVALVSTV